MLADDQLVEQQPKRVHIGPLRQRSARQQLFGRPVVGCAVEHLRTRVEAGDGDPEIRDPRLALVIDQDVGGLQDAMQDAFGVRRREPRAQLPRDVDDLLRWKPPHASDQ